MKKQFYITFGLPTTGLKFEAVEGHIINHAGLQFGIYKPYKSQQHWVIVEISTGVKINSFNYLTLKEAKEALTNGALSVDKINESLQIDDFKNIASQLKQYTIDHPLNQRKKAKRQKYDFYIFLEGGKLQLIQGGKIFEKDGVFFGIDKWHDHTLNKTFYSTSELTTGARVNVGSYRNEKECEKDITPKRAKLVKSFLDDLAPGDHYYNNITVIKQAYINDNNPLKNILYKEAH